MIQNNKDNYLQDCLTFINSEWFNDENERNFYLKKIFLLYTPSKISLDVFHNLVKDTSIFFNVPYHDVKLVGSSQTGFSFVDKFENGKIKFHSTSTNNSDNKKSDIDLAIINSNLFDNIHLKTLKNTNMFQDNRIFSKPWMPEYYQRNHLKGFIRPDTIADVQERIKWAEFFDTISSNYSLDVNCAIYKDEFCFSKRLEKQFIKFSEMEEVKHGVK